MASTTQRHVMIDGRTYQVAPLTLGPLRRMLERGIEGKSEIDLFDMWLETVHAAMRRAGNAPELAELRDATDVPDLLAALDVVLELSRGPDTGERASP